MLIKKRIFFWKRRLWVKKQKRIKIICEFSFLLAKFTQFSKKVINNI
jgi:hypothetical protein